MKSSNRRKEASCLPKGAEENPEATSYLDPELGILVTRSKRPFTMEDIRRAEQEEDDRHLCTGPDSAWFRTVAPENSERIKA